MTTHSLSTLSGLFGLALLLTSCGTASPGDYVLVVAPTPETPGAALVIQGDGVSEQVALQDGQGTLTLPLDKRLADVTATLTFPGACGPREQAARLDYAAFAEDNARDDGTAFKATVLPQADAGEDLYAAWRLLVDPAAATGHTLQVGALPVTVPADGRVSIPRASGCTPEVVLDGQTLGTLPDESGHWLVAVSETACFRHTVWAYGAAFSGGSQRTLQGERLYRLDADVSFFLEPAPASLWSTEAQATRGELVRAPCAD